MLPFNEKSICPKCRSESVDAHYQAEAHCKLCAGEREVQEHIRRICERCRYLWSEACLSQKEEP